MLSFLGLFHHEQKLTFSSFLLFDLRLYPLTPTEPLNYWPGDEWYDEWPGDGENDYPGPTALCGEQPVWCW